MATKRIVLLIAITALLIASTSVPALALLSNGQTAPNFQFTDQSGHVQTLNEYRGKVVVIQFFGAYCGYCQSDAKGTLVPLYNTYYKNDPSVQFLGVEVDGSPASAIQTYAQETGVTWPVGGGAAVSAYQIASTPTLYVISPAGNVALTMTYPTNAQTLRSTIASLEGKPTQLSLSASNTSPGVNQAITFTATLKSGTKAISEPITIYHYLDGVRYNDITAYSTLAFAQKWTTPGVRTYYASFAGGSSYEASTSSVVTINVEKPTQLTLTASNVAPTVNKPITFTATSNSTSGVSCHATSETRQ